MASRASPSASFGSFARHLFVRRTVVERMTDSITRREAYGADAGPDYFLGNMPVFADCFGRLWTVHLDFYWVGFHTGCNLVHQVQQHLCGERHTKFSAGRVCGAIYLWGNRYPVGYSV